MKLLKIITPLTIVLIIVGIVIIDSFLSSHESGGWSMIGVIMGVPIAIAGFFIDFFVRIYFKKDVKRIWLYELAIILIGVVLILYMQAN
ncbi:MAG: hypothetical protein ABIX01_06910 [Chitinophagaceae bacterium]